MIVKFEAFEKNSENYRSFRFFLFHGQNYGKVSECADLIKNFKDIKKDYEVINLFSDDIKKENLSRIFLESSSPNILAPKLFCAFILAVKKSVKK